MRTAIIGCGAISRHYLQDVRFFAPDNPLRADSDPVLDLCAACDLRTEAVEGFAAEAGVPGIYTDFVHMLDQARPEFVYLGTPANVRVEPVVAAAQRGIHVLCEKPMATDPAECDAMIEACDRAGVQLVISHQRRSDPVHWFARRLVDEGAIGALRYVSGAGKPRRGGNEMHNIGSHLLDAAGILAGPPQWVSATCSTGGRSSVPADREPGDRNAGWVLGDRVDVTVGYESGVQGSFQFSEDPSEFHWFAQGTDGRLAVFGNTLWRSDDALGRPSATWEQVPLPAEPVVTGSGYVNPTDWLAISRALGSLPRVFMMRELFQRMQSGGEHTSSGRVGAIPIEIMQSAFHSHLTGQRAPVPLAQRKSVLAE